MREGKLHKMKGLLIKDLYYVFQRKQTLLIFLIVSLILGFTNEGSFLVGYMTLLGTIISLSTISYDNADNGMPFLMTLPISRKEYALSKYVFGAVLCTVSWIVAVGIDVLISFVSKTNGTDLIDNLESGIAFLFMAFLFIDLMIPFYLKYGPEKSKIVLALIYGLGIAAVMIFEKKFSATDMGNIIKIISSIPNFCYIIVSGFLFCIFTIVSINISSKIMKEKTF